MELTAFMSSAPAGYFVSTPASGGFDRIDVADHVGDRDVRCRELLDEARVARQPRDRQRVAFLRQRARQAAHSGASGSS